MTTVFIVDDDEAVRDSIGLLLRSVGLRSTGFADAHAFLQGYLPETPGCLILDVRMPRMSGLELQQELGRRGWRLPILFITGHGDVPMAVEAMRAGAFDFLQKPFNDDELIRKVQKALDKDAQRRSSEAERDKLRAGFESLTPREREVAERVAAGQANKVIALELGLSERTVELHRAHAMQKTGARNLADLVQRMLILQTPPD